MKTQGYISVYNTWVYIYECLLVDGCFVCVVTSVVCVTLPPPQGLQNQSSDIRLVSERVLWWVFKDPATPSMEASLIKPLLKSLLDNTKDKNTSVRAQSEHTIVNLLQLRQGDETMQVRLQTLCCNLHTYMTKIVVFFLISTFCTFYNSEYYCHSGLCE